jgi:hypothetical protein
MAEWKYIPEFPGYKITTKQLSDFIFNEINNIWKGEQFDDTPRFPGAQPVSIEKKDFTTIKGENYVVCAKLDGERYFLYTTKIPLKLCDIGKPVTSSFVNINFLMNRKLEIFIVDSSWSDRAYTGKCLFDGELIKNEFVIHDSIIVGGENIKNKSWDYRWKCANEFIMKNYNSNGKNTFGIRLKKFYTTNNIQGLFNEIQNEKIESDGIVFYPMKDPVKFRNQPNLFKWKPPGHHTVDFNVKIVGNQVNLITWHQSEEKVYRSLNIDDFKDFPIENNDIVEFRVDQLSHSKNAPVIFIPILKRNDKPNGNNLFTVRKTILNAVENIQEQDLINEFQTK